MQRISLNQVVENWATNGIFHYLDSLAVPWQGDIGTVSLDLDYHGGHSGDKRISPLVKNLLADNNTISDTNMRMLASTALSLFGVTWAKMYEQLSIEYNPINNYDMIEEERESGSGSRSEAHSGTDGRTISHTTTNAGNDTVTNTGTETTAHTGTRGVSGSDETQTSGSSTSEDGIAGFNSSTYQDDRNNETTTEANSESTTTQTTTDNLQDQRTDNLTQTTTHGHTITEAGTDNLVHGENITGSDSHMGTRTLTRSGNIGVNTTAQMLEQERILWAWNFFRNVVYKDLDSLLTLQTY